MEVAAADDRIRVLVVQDDDSLTERFERVARAERDIELIGCVSSIIEMTRLAVGCSPDVVFTDYWLAGGTGADVIRQMRALRPGAAVIVLMTAALSHRAFQDVTWAGAWSLLDRGVQPARIAEVARRAVEARPRRLIGSRSERSRSISGTSGPRILDWLPSQAPGERPASAG